MHTRLTYSSKLLRAFSFMVVLGLVLGALGLPVQAAPTGQRLRTLAGSFLIGYASRNDFWSMSDAAQYQDVARTEFNFLTPENAMKWDATEPQQNVFTFSQADQHVSFAQTNTMKIHGHTLVWHSQLPGWVSGISGATNLTNVMYNHIDKVMNHWTDGQIYAWDVVNEAFNEDGTRRSTPFQNVIGNSYIELAFQRARAADPQTKLIYNDYNVETVNSKSTAMYNMVADFKNRGIPIDGVGLQMHLTNGGMDYNSLASNMQRFAALGVEVYITEMDVRFPTPLSQTDLQTQATIYGNVLAKCKAQPMCKALQVWGIPDKYSWVPSVFQGQGGALIFDDNYNAKPAYYALQSGLGGSATNTPTNTAIGPTPTRTNTPIGPTPTRTNTPIGPTPTRTNTPPPSNTPTNTAIGPTPTRTNTPTSGGGTCTTITGGGSYSVSASGTCFKYVNAAFVRGGMFSVMNPGDSTVSNTVKWYGGRNETVTNCINDSQTLNGNGAQLNNFTVAKDSNNAMFVTVTGNKVNTITLSIQNWQNGTGCSVLPTPSP
jgi:endo-1,4-beta-xylanase